MTAQLSQTERKLIALIFRNKTMARTDLAEATGLTGASVTRLINRLQEDGFFHETRTRTGAQGQPKRNLALNPDRFFSIGIVFSLRTMELALLNFRGAICATRHRILSGARPEDVARAAASGVADLSRNLPPDSLLGVGVSLPGNFGTYRDLLVAHELFDQLGDDRVITALRSAFDIPVHIENDGTSAAIAEFMLGEGVRDEDPLFFLHIGHGVGGGAILDGKPYRGAHGNACLPGFLFPYEELRPSGQDLLKHMNNAGHKIEDLDGLTQPASGLAADLDAWIDRASQQIALAQRAITGFFDPAEIVLGGRLPGWINEALVARAATARLPGPSRGLPNAPLKTSAFGPEGGAIGAACLPLFETFL